MSIEKGFPLANVAELSQEQKEQLRFQGITTAEQFVGHAWAVSEEFAEFLGMTKEELRFLTEAISKYIDPKVLDAMLTLQEAMPKHGMGAMLSPPPGLLNPTICWQCADEADTDELKVCKHCGKMYCRACAEKFSVCRGCGMPMREPRPGYF